MTVSESNDWMGLRTLPLSSLLSLGLRQWNDPSDADSKELFGGKTLLLLPAHWHADLPRGFELVSINGKRVTVGVDNIDADQRFGCLAYGVLR